MSATHTWFGQHVEVIAWSQVAAHATASWSHRCELSARWGPRVALNRTQHVHLPEMLPLPNTLTQYMCNFKDIIVSSIYMHLCWICVPVQNKDSVMSLQCGSHIC